MTGQEALTLIDAQIETFIPEGIRVLRFNSGICGCKHAIWPIYNCSTGLPGMQYGCALFIPNGASGVEGSLPLPGAGVAQLNGGKAITIGFDIVKDATTEEIRSKVDEAVSQLLAA